MTYPSSRFVGAAFGLGSVLGLVFACGGAVATDSGDDSTTGGSASGGAGTGGTAAGGSASGGTSSSGGSPASTSCSGATDCSLVSRTCCGACGSPTVDDVLALAKGSEDEHFDEVCGEKPLCPACAQQPNPHLLALCEDGTCVAHDLATSDASSCQDDDDCVVRPAACCECGASTDPGTLVALRRDSNLLLEAFCEPGAGCPDCAWVAPSEASATCQNSHCVLVDTRTF